MAVKIILGNTFQAAYEGVLSELAENLKKTNHKHIVLVPDKFSLTLEKSILTALGLRGSINIRVLSFTRFATLSLKNKIKKCLTPEGSVMLLQKVINSKRDQLLCYKNVCLTSGFAGEIYAAITLIRNSGVSLDDLKASLDKIEQPNLKKKVSDIILLFEGYLAELQENRNDSSTRLEKFAKHIPDLEDLSSTHIYISDFYEFTAPQYDIIEQLMNYSASVTVGLVEGTGENKRLYPNGTLNSLTAIASKCDCGLKIIRKNTIIKPCFEFIKDNLYSYSPKTFEGAGDAVKLYQAGDIFSEVERLASEIKKLIIERNYRYLNIAVVACDMEVYAPVFHSVFKRFDIPYFLDRKRLLSEQTPVRFLKSAIEVYINSFRRDEVLEFVKNPFFYFESGVTLDDIDDFENYSVKYNISYSRFNNPFTIADDLQAKAEKVRQRLIKLTPLFKKTDSAEGYLHTLDNFFTASQYYENLIKFADYEDKMNEPFFSKITVQIEEKMTAVFDEIADTIGGETFIFSDFYRILFSMLDTVKIALAPLYIDSVFVGEITESRFENVRALFVVGATAGNVPKESTARAVLSVKDEENLEAADIVVKPNKKASNLSDLFYIVQLLARASDYVKISYPKMILSEKQNPSTLINLIRDSFTEDGKPLKIKYNAEGISDKKLLFDPDERARSFSYKFGSPQNTYFELLGKVVSEKIAPDFMEPYDAGFSILDEDKKAAVNLYLAPPEEERNIDGQKLFLSKDHISISQLECYFNCPYKHYFQYGLRIKKQADGTVQSTDTGTFVHAVLEGYFNLFISGKLGWENSEKEEQITAVRGIVEGLFLSKEFKALLEDKKQKSVYKRLGRECEKICTDLTAVQKRSAFKPYMLEAGFGYNAESKFDAINLKVNGKDLKLVGFIDRIDVYKDMFYIIDYKTYNKKTSFKDVFYGTAIQLIAYMGAVSEQGKLTPAGAYYLPVTSGYNKDDGRYNLSGYTVNDVEVVKLLDSRIAEGVRGEMFTLSLNKNGEVKATNSALLERDDFTRITDYVKKLMGTAAEEISGGFIEASPYAEKEEDKCRYCDYKNICQYFEQVNIRKPKPADLKDIRGAVNE